ncbi:MAG TPA: hemolysin family protein [Candidatus Angelobacter sp.]|jgi:CBS domain containing-hemolysin-like protein|nr:hemolysin family protein [Candidatus Angelobacter sp.]
MNGMITLVWLRIILMALLVAANAFFVAAEFAMVSVRDTRIQQLIEQRRLGARTVQKMQQRLDEFLPAVQLGVTLASLGLGWAGEGTLAGILQPWMQNVPYARFYAHGIALTVAFIIITYMHVLLGELVPKSLALHRAERVALAVAGPMDFFISLAHPFLVVMNKSANLVLRGFGSRLMREGGVHSPEELKLIVTASRRVGLLPEVQEEMIHNALELGNLTAREIMVPRHNIFSLSADMPVEEAMAKVVEEQHSRVPVYDPTKGKESIIGLLYSKDVSRVMHMRLAAGMPFAKANAGLKVSHIMRDVLFVPEAKPIADLLAEFQQRKRHLAIVVDEFGSTAGLVTVEDILEQLVGELEDEFDVAQRPVIPLTTGAVVLDGAANIRDLEVQYEISLPRDQGFETLAGFVMARLGKIPRGGESFEFQGRRYTVLHMEGRRIARVKIENIAQSPPLESVS